jgi:two-component system LytT family sensor kinase
LVVALEPRRRRSRRIWIVATTFWLLVCLLYIGQIWLLTLEPGNRVTISRGTVVWQGAFYASWIPLTVLIGRLTARWDFASLGWPRLLARHVALMLAVAATQAAFVAFIGLTLVPERESTWVATSGQFRGRLYQDVVMYLAVVLFSQTLLFYDRSRARELEAAQLETQLHAARLDSLRAQLHPHFLFNSLHTIAALVRDHRNDEAVRLISGMSDLLRRHIDTTTPTHAIENELAAARTYLDVQHARFGDRLKTEVTLTADVAGALVPVLLVQPLLENSLRHGLADRVETGHIYVAVFREGREAVIRVEDSGAGVPATWRLERAAGTGLANIRGRLEAMYPGRGRIHAGPRPGGGFGVTIRLPYTAI